MGFPLFGVFIMSMQQWCGCVCTAMLMAMATTLDQGLGQLHAQEGARKLKFEVYKDSAKEFRWRLKAGNGEILATAGQGYKAKADCKKSADRIKEEAATDKLKFETYEDKAMEHRWRCKASNGQVVASSSQGYKAKADCEHAIDLIKKGAANAEVEEVAK
jgi:uncharacterized protein YegP (UPF0339 family)